MSYDTTQCAKEIIKGLRLTLMLYPTEEQRDGLIRATCMLEDHLTIQKILG